MNEQVIAKPLVATIKGLSLAAMLLYSRAG